MSSEGHGKISRIELANLYSSLNFLGFDLLRRSAKEMMCYAVED